MTPYELLRPAAFPYPSPLKLPEAEVGRFAIKHNRFEPANGPVAVVSLREALLTGRPPVALALREPLLIHELVERREGEKIERVWMTDEPQELRAAGEWLDEVEPEGHVLVGGLGLGLITTWLASRPEVEHVTVVERSPEVVALVGPHVATAKVEIVESDIAEYLRTVPSWGFDFAFLDTWQATSEGTWWTEVMPLRRTIANRFGPRDVHCWAEDIMLGQISKALYLGNRSIRQALGLPMFKGRPWYYTGFPEEMTDAEIEHFTTKVGLTSWELLWSKCLTEPKDWKGDSK